MRLLYRYFFSLVSSNLVSGEVSSAPLLPASVPRAPEEGEESGVVKLENEEGWGEDNSIPNEAYEVNLPKNYEQVMFFMFFLAKQDINNCF